MLSWLLNLGFGGSTAAPPTAAGHHDLLGLVLGWRARWLMPPASIGQQAAFVAGSRVEAAYAAGSLCQAGYTAGSLHETASLTPNP